MACDSLERMGMLLGNQVSALLLRFRTILTPASTKSFSPKPQNELHRNECFTPTYVSKLDDHDSA